MQNFSTILNQILDLIPRSEFNRHVKQFSGDKYVKHFTTFNLLTVLLMAQAKGQDSLRHVVSTFSYHKKKWAHLGIKHIARSTIADANNRLDHRVFETLFYTLVSKCQSVSKTRQFSFKNPVFAMDASVIDLCLSVFDWAKFRKRKGAIKLHSLYDLQRGIPTVSVITEGKDHECKVAKDPLFMPCPDSIIVFDRGYNDFTQFQQYTNKGVWFVTRAKKNIAYTITGQLAKNSKEGVYFDDTIEVNSDGYAGLLRLIGYFDETTQKVFQFLTNNFSLTALQIAEIYKSRWEVELFFKWIKQNLKVKTFLGTSKNAVYSQIWVSLCYLLILTFIRHQTQFKRSLLTLSRLIKEAFFERVSFLDILSLKPPDVPFVSGNLRQLSLNL
jgi:hypothetical protein